MWVLDLAALESRADHAVAAFRRMAAATSSFARDGIELRIPAAEIVPG